MPQVGQGLGFFWDFLVEGCDLYVFTDDKYAMLVNLLMS